jgi:mono/diheme cytochrome c family protein
MMCFSRDPSFPQTAVETSVRKLAKFAGIAVLALLILAAIGITFTIGWRPFIGPKTRPLANRTFERTPQRFERGRYLAVAVTGCMGCHSEHDWKNHGAIPPGTEGAGEVMPIAELPGKIVAPNITPDPETGAGTWSDDQLARAIREGIGHDGRALFPMMPYQAFRKMSDEDLASIIVYLRSLPPVRRPLPRSEIIFPVKYLISGVPEPLATAVPARDLSDPVRRGEYLVTLAGCAGCHTPQVRGQNVPGMDLAGGFTLTGPWGRVASSNITPDASGIGYYDESLFLQVMRTGYVKARELSPIMPVFDFKNMRDDDLEAMFAYLRTLKPVKHRVDNAEEVSECKLCRQKHGGGKLN